MKPEKKQERIETGQTDENEFARFDDLMKRLMSVPKSEVDEKQAEYEAKKTVKKTTAKSRQ